MPHHTASESSSSLMSTLRNEPVQARSNARLTRLLDAAAEVVDDIGFERLTTAMVADRAGASIGTVYRYFPDRIVVLQALALRNRSEFLDQVVPVLRNPDHASWWEALESVVDVMSGLFASAKGFRSLRFGDAIDLRRAADDVTNAVTVAREMASTLGQRFDLDNAELSFHLEVVLEIVDSLLARAFVLDSSGDRRFIDEAKATSKAYLVSKLGKSA